MNMKATYLWWKFLCITAIVNIIVWLVAISIRSDMSNFSHWQPVLSGIYVFVCAFRSFFPRIDLERYCLFDTPLSSVVLGRTSATIAELAFSAQCALLIYDLGIQLNSSIVIYIAYAIVPIIILAQTSCWYAALTLNHFWHAIEEAAWVLMILLAGGCLYLGFTELSGVLRTLMAIGLLSCVGCAFIMLFIDIPMYLNRAKQNDGISSVYLGVSEGFQDAATRRVPTSDWRVWKQEALWITPYFTFGVWLSIGMAVIHINV